jgi:hypothetical protein
MRESISNEPVKLLRAENPAGLGMVGLLEAAQYIPDALACGWGDMMLRQAGGADGVR